MINVYPVEDKNNKPLRFMFFAAYFRNKLYVVKEVSFEDGTPWVLSFFDLDYTDSEHTKNITLFEFDNHEEYLQMQELIRQNPNLSLDIFHK